jgi:hypothetical protein
LVWVLHFKTSVEEVVANYKLSFPLLFGLKFIVSSEREECGILRLRCRVTKIDNGKDRNIVAPRCDIRHWSKISC